MTFFYGTLIISALSLTLSLVVLFDKANPKTRRVGVVDRLQQEATGLIALVLIASIQWAAAYVAFIRHPNLELPNSYPLFKIITSYYGFFTFGCLGLASRHYRTEGAKLSGASFLQHVVNQAKRIGRRLDG